MLHGLVILYESTPPSEACWELPHHITTSPAERLRVFAKYLLVEEVAIYHVALAVEQPVQEVTVSLPMLESPIISELALRLVVEARPEE